MKVKILWQLQLSNYTPEGQFVLTADSNWQIFATKIAQMLKLNNDLDIDVILPTWDQCVESPRSLLNELGINDDRVSFIRTPIITNAPATRFDFPYMEILKQIRHNMSEYTHVYINDPMLLEHYKALFHLNKCNPKFVLQTHFLDSPIAQVVPKELSYWYGTIGACDKADIFLWHCKSMQDVFKQALETEFQPHVVERLMAKSEVWKDGFSTQEINKPVDMKNIRFDISSLYGKIVVWVPNRIGGLGKSFDYTNNGKFLFEAVPELWKQRQDFVVVAGNPNQKISNDELVENCPAYVKLVDGALNRDEYRLLSRWADIVVGLYTNDTNGGLASLEAIEHKAVPLFPDIYEYKVYFDAVDWPYEYRIATDLSNISDVLSVLIDGVKFDTINKHQKKLQEFIRMYAAYEHTTPEAMKMLGML